MAALCGLFNGYSKMAMKQTQTKMFDFSDVGLDFCAGSKNLFPDRFKKMLAQGYNTQTVASVGVVDNQVTLTYGVSHGYVADRVLKVDSGALASINSGEFWIDSVTTNTLAFTLDDAPSSIVGGFATKIASLGWSLEYESSYIHLYKMKQLDESDIFVRLVFQPIATRRNRVGVCIGKSADLASGVITDANTMTEYATAIAPDGTFAWEFSYYANATYNNHTYAQGLSMFGKGLIVGSLYHFLAMSHYYNASPYYDGLIAILPAKTINYDDLNYPLLIGCNQGNAASNGYSTGYLNGNFASAYVGRYRVNFVESASAAPPLLTTPNSLNNFVPIELDTFNTTTARPLQMYFYGNGQFAGVVGGGVYLCAYAANALSSETINTLPKKSTDIDLSNICYLFTVSGSANSATVGLIAPIEEIKIV